MPVFSSLSCLTEILTGVACKSVIKPAGHQPALVHRLCVQTNTVTTLKAHCCAKRAT